MKLKKLFKDYDNNLADARTVEIYDSDKLIFKGLISNIPSDILDRELDKWSNMMETKVFNDEVIDEDNESITVSMYLSVRVF